MKLSTRLALSFLAASVLAGEGAAAAQTPEEGSGPKWEIEIYGGGFVTRGQTSGSGTLPPTGAIVGGWVSASSFYFGDAAQLLTESVTGSQPKPTLTPLDAVLHGFAVQRRHLAGTAGIRFGRAINRRLGIVIAAEYSPNDLRFTDASQLAIEATRSSYIPALQRAMSYTPSSVTSIVAFSPKQAQQLFTTGALQINMRTAGRVIPYVTVGGGVVFNTGDTPSVTLTGTSQLGSPAQILETDSVTLHYSLKDRAYVGTAGGGVKYAIGRRWGLRVDGRVLGYQNTLVSLVDTTADIALSSTGSPFPLTSSGALQFSATGPLNGIPIFNHPTFSGSGLQWGASLTAGLLWRF